VSRPFIHVNFATDGREWPHGVAASISCDADWRRVHTLRERYDAVAVGARTWNMDHPRLTVRQERLGREPQRQPVRAIFAGTQGCHVMEDDGPVFLIGAPGLACCGATVIASYDHNLLPPLESLYRHGIRSMLVEGGPTILHSFFSQGLADAVTIFVRAHDEEAAHRIAHAALPCLPLSMLASKFGEGFLLAATRTPADQTPALPTASTGRLES
jgi:riboflavin biosynthesis pyrimidine reductase